MPAGACLYQNIVFLSSSMPAGAFVVHKTKSELFLELEPKLTRMQIQTGASGILLAEFAGPWTRWEGDLNPVSARLAWLDCLVWLTWLGLAVLAGLTLGSAGLAGMAWLIRLGWLADLGGLDSLDGMAGLAWLAWLGGLAGSSGLASMAGTAAWLQWRTTPRRLRGTNFWRSWELG